MESEATRAARTIVLGALVLGAGYFLLQPLVHYLGLLFGGFLLALALGSTAAVVAKRTRLPQGAALALVLAALLGAWVAIGAWIGPVVSEQFAELDVAVPRGIEQGRSWLAETDVGRGILERIETAQDEGTVTDALPSLTRGLVTGLDALGEALVLVLFGIFLAAAPGAYLTGALLLLPAPRRARAAEVLHAIARALRLWLLARLLLMCFVGLAFGLGLFALGIPLALPLGFLAGALGFIPFVGPTLAFIPAFAVGLLDSPETAMRVAVLYIGIQIVEGNILEPVVESRTVSLRPALILAGQVLTAVWFGPIGVLIATPLVVVAVVLVQTLYLQDRLGESILVVGERRAPPPEPPAALATPVESHAK